MATERKGSSGSDVLDPRFVAGVDMLRRTGADTFAIRYSDDEEPVVWFAVVHHWTKDGVPVAMGTPDARVVWETAAGHDPTQAVMRLCEQLIDGGMCAHCKRPAGFSDDLEPMPIEETICWTQWDPELATFRRACEGDTP